jgi:glycosyltransferase involved in cell wall biosynthesis
MRVVNIMLSKSGGGIEQSFLDYCKVLVEKGHYLNAVSPSKALVNDHIPKEADVFHLDNFGAWDILAAWRLRRFLVKYKPDVIIAHANRALALAAKAVKGKVPIVAVAHNYNIKHYTKADAVFVISKDLFSKVEKLGIEVEKIFYIPNMIAVDVKTKTTLRRLPVIGAIGRFVAKKGFDVYLQALRILQNKGIKFKAILAGRGQEEQNLKDLATKLRLTKNISFVGWVEDKNSFYNNIDIFCLPSLHEPFGIVLLEAFTHKVPIVSTDSEGPSEIIKQDYNGLLVEKNNPEALAEGIVKLLEDKTLRSKLAKNGYSTVVSYYSQEVVGKKISEALSQVIKSFAKTNG